MDPIEGEEPDVYRFVHYAFATERTFVEEAKEALATFASDGDDIAVLETFLADWSLKRAVERSQARFIPAADHWAELLETVDREGVAGLGERREVNRHSFEVLCRAVRRLNRVRALNAPEFLTVDVLEFVRAQIDNLDDISVPTRAQSARIEGVVQRSGSQVPDLEQFGLEVAHLACGAFPTNLGLGEGFQDRLVGCEPPALAALDDFWAIHQQRVFEDDLRALTLVPDAFDMPLTTLDSPLLDLNHKSGACELWRAVHPALWAGSFGGCITVGTEPTNAQREWWPAELSFDTDARVVSFVVAHTQESPPFLPDE
ncbi:MAG: hypothetical protein AAF411_06685 [Myxococcota bacterium]